MQIIAAPEVTVVRAIELWVAGVPKPQGSKRAFVHPHTKRVVMTESAGTPLKDWRYDVKIAATSVMATQPMIVHPAGVHLSVGLVLPRPLSTPKTKATPLAVKKPDLDKLVRAIGDALSGTVYADDSQVVGMTLHKRLAELGEPTGAAILVEEVILASCAPICAPGS